MEAVLARPVWPPKMQRIGSFANWLLCWILLPNLAFCLMWLVGGPPRTMPIIITASMGLALHRAPFPLKFGAFLVALSVSTAFYISGLFNLSIFSLMASVRFASELRPEASLQYVVAGAALLLTVVIAGRSLQSSTVLAKPVLLVAAMAAGVALAVADRQAADAHGGSYHRSASPGDPFESAISRSGIEGLATGERHVMVVMVESMGKPADAAIRKELINLWATPEVRSRYQVTSGDTLYYGSTTSGEMRELCGRWGDYQEVIGRADTGCLPHRMKAKGYGTQAWHSFTGAFFDRTKWYPNIGFQTLRFGDSIMADGAQRCPGVFPGACDTDVPGQIAAALKKAEKPQFLYWLTVNTHLPVLKHERLGTSDCKRFSTALDAQYPMICRLNQILDRTAGALAKEITAPDFPPTDILIVGDHIPPFYDRHHRTQFAPDRVPWILLRADPAPKPGFTAA
ncbi:MAG TPA: sulfatase-like hydrolase/transferase [Allosphingosinicella sp.]|uniref:sulfatase-like hydrolase/transferase n=1 Tax=Allosphingosinicella sp. TaxID=2823234 RepID=UPI002ED8DC95